MKKFTFEEKRIYIAEIEYNNQQTSAVYVFNAYQERFPEDGLKYDYEFINCGLSVCRIYRETCFDFVEK